MATERFAASRVGEATLRRSAGSAPGFPGTSWSSATIPRRAGSAGCGGDGLRSDRTFRRRAGAGRGQLGAAGMDCDGTEPSGAGRGRHRDSPEPRGRPRPLGAGRGQLGSAGMERDRTEPSGAGRGRRFPGGPGPSASPPTGPRSGRGANSVVRAVWTGHPIETEITAAGVCRFAPCGRGSRSRGAARWPARSPGRGPWLAFRRSAPEAPGRCHGFPERSFPSRRSRSGSAGPSHPVRCRLRVRHRRRLR